MSEVATPARHRDLGLTDSEYERIVEKLGREPNDVELAVFSLMWSEHCGYKHSRKLLRRLPTEGEHVVMGPGENAGAVDVGDGLAIAFKVESHNHPSAVEPFQGAATGVGGILRDVFAIGARPIAVLDSLHFGKLSSARSRYLMNGAVAGIGHYGNSIGVATVGGEIRFGEPYESNCLINAMCVGIAPKERLVRSAAAGVGNLVVLLGALTGRDGIGGASVLASAELGEESASKRPSVQIGDPFEEKKVLECCLELLDRELLASLQDLGAAGLSSSASEMASGGAVGIDLDVARVPRREPGMEAFEVMVSESQERMLCVVEPGRLDAVRAVCDEWDVRCTAIGAVTDTRRLRVLEAGEPVGDMPVEALVDDCPLYDLVPERPTEPVYAPPRARLDAGADPTATLLALLRSENIASKRWAYEQYDGLVGSRTVRRPGSADAAVLHLEHDGASGAIAVSIDGNGRRVACDPYAGARRGRARVRGQPGLRRGRAARPDQLPQLRQPREAAHRVAARAGGQRPGRRLSRARRAGRRRQRVALQRGLDRPDLSDAGRRHGRARARRRLAASGGLRRGRARGRPARTLPSGSRRVGARGPARGDGSGPAGTRSRVTRASAPRRRARPCARAAWPPRTTSRMEDSPVRSRSACLAGGIGARVDLDALLARLDSGEGEAGALATALFGEGPGGMLIAGTPEVVEQLVASLAPDTAIVLGKTGGSRLTIETGSAARLDVEVAAAAEAFERGVADHFS